MPDMILTGGANVYPAEVEAALQEHPAVRSCAVIGLPDDDLGNRVHAIVEADPERRSTDDELLRVRRRAARPLQGPPHRSSSSTSRCATTPARSGAAPSAPSAASSPQRDLTPSPGATLDLDRGSEIGWPPPPVEGKDHRRAHHGSAGDVLTARASSAFPPRSSRPTPPACATSSGTRCATATASSATTR